MYSVQLEYIRAEASVAPNVLTTPRGRSKVPIVRIRGICSTAWAKDVILAPDQTEYICTYIYILRMYRIHKHGVESVHGDAITAVTAVGAGAGEQQRPIGDRSQRRIGAEPQAGRTRDPGFIQPTQTGCRWQMSISHDLHPSPITSA